MCRPDPLLEGPDPSLLSGDMLVTGDRIEVNLQGGQIAASN